MYLTYKQKSSIKMYLRLQAFQCCLFHLSMIVSTIDIITSIWVIMVKMDPI